MKDTNTNRNKNTETRRRKNHDPHYKRIIVGHRMVAMHASHVDALAPPGRVIAGSRCPRCFLKTEKSRHGCRWNIESTVEPKDSSPPMLQLPIYAWVRRDSE